MQFCRFMLAISYQRSTRNHLFMHSTLKHVHITNGVSIWIFMSGNLTITKFKVLKPKLQSPFKTKCHICKIKSALGLFAWICTDFGKQKRNDSYTVFFRELMDMRIVGASSMTRTSKLSMYCSSWDIFSSLSVSSVSCLSTMEISSC